MDGMAEENGGAARNYLLFAWSPDGYELFERTGEPPEVGAELEDDGYHLAVVKVGPSPLPGDSRRCVYTVGAR
jgi:hypothetical protein